MPRWAKKTLLMTLVASPSREPVVPSRDHPQLSPGLQLGARVQQCAQSVCGTAGPGEGTAGDWQRGRGSPLQLGQELQPSSVPGLGDCQQSPGEPWPEPGDSVSSHGCPASGTQGAGLGLRHWSEYTSHLGRFGGAVCTRLDLRASGRVLGRKNTWVLSDMAFCL